MRVPQHGNFQLKRRTQFLKNITKFGDKYSKNVWNDLKITFWINVITYYYTYFSKYVLKSSNELNATIFLYNGNKVIGNRPITNSKLAKNGPFQIRQIKKDISYLTLQGLNRQFEINLNFLQYNSLINRGVYSSTILKKFPLPHLKTFPKFYYRKEEKTSLGKGISNILKKFPLPGGGGVE